MDLGLKGRTAFIAGASSGLGYAAAAALAAEGCNMVICSRDRGRIESAAERLGAFGTKVKPVVCDVTNEHDIRAAVDQTVEMSGGKLNIVVTNSGGPKSGYVNDFDADDWRAGIELNLMSTINLCRHTHPLVQAAAQEQDGIGRIIMITSVSAKQPVPNLYLSNVSRAGVQGFAKSLSEELGPTGVTVNTILPGYTETERLTELAESTHSQTGREIDDIFAGWAAATALKRLGKPEEFGAAVAFLASRQAAFITGLAFPVDGGRIKSLM